MNEFMQLFIYGYYLFGGIAITLLAMRFAFEQMRGNAGLIAIASRVVGFVVMFLALMLIMPALFEFGVNNAMGRLQKSTISRNIIGLTRDTAELLTQQNSEIEPISLEDRPLVDAAAELRTELETHTGTQRSAPVAPQSSGNHTAESAPHVPQAIVQPAPVQRPLVLAPQYLTAEPKPLVLLEAQNTAEPTTIPLMLLEAQNTPTPLPLMLLEAADVGGPQTYTVQTGDSLFKIAQRFGVSVNALCRANDLRDCNVVARGKKLVIP